MKTKIFLVTVLLFSFVLQKSNAQSTTNSNTWVVGDFLGYNNIHAAALEFEVDGQKSGWLDYSTPYNTTFGYQAGNALGSLSTLNVAIGYEALSSNSLQSGNVAIGDSALYTQTYTLAINSGNVAIGNSALYAANPHSAFAPAKSNTAVGQWALRYDNIGPLNTAIGFTALYSNDTGNDNTACGVRAMFGNTTGSFNVAFGVAALENNTTGYNNTAVGPTTLVSNTTGWFNTAIGIAALSGNATAYYNTGVGSSALVSNTTGSSNTAVGRQAGLSNTGSWNTFLGDSAGFYNTTGTYNTFLGYQSGDDPSFATVVNTSCLGYQSGLSATTIASDAVYLGNNSTTVVYGANYMAYSDRRIKDNISENIPGLTFINKLHPVTYNLDINKEEQLTGAKNTGNWPGKYDIEKITQSGFIAQQVDSAAKACGYDFNGISKPTTPNGLYALGYADFVVPLVKAVQELSAKNDTLRDSLRHMNSAIDSLRSAFKGIQSCLNQICGATGSNTSGNAGTADFPASAQNITLGSADAPLLYQNTPNPFNTGTKINYYLPAGTTGASMVFYDSYGNQLKVAPLSQTGNGTLNITPDNLGNGVYSYSLVVNGNVIDTKRMVVQK